MTDASDIDGQLAVHGWRYHAGSETLLERDDNEIDWSNLLAALPDLSMNLLESYRDAKFAKLNRR